MRDSWLAIIQIVCLLVIRKRLSQLTLTLSQLSQGCPGSRIAGFDVEGVGQLPSSRILVSKFFVKSSQFDFWIS